MAIEVGHLFVRQHSLFRLLRASVLAFVKILSLVE